MQKTLQALLITPRTDRDAREQILHYPVTIQDLSDFIGKVVNTSVQTIAVTQKIPVLHKKHARFF